MNWIFEDKMTKHSAEAEKEMCLHSYGLYEKNENTW
jgi:hypothetical protein